jgi:hypothetical protein
MSAPYAKHNEPTMATLMVFSSFIVIHTESCKFDRFIVTQRELQQWQPQSHAIRSFHCDTYEVRPFDMGVHVL